MAWVSLDDSANDPARFWRCLIAALRIHFPRLGQAALSHLCAPRGLSTQAALAAVINDLAALDGAFAVALDDYDCVSNATTHAAVANLIEHFPPQGHLLVAARAEPPWPELVRWRAKGQVSQLSAADLAFTADEVAAFCRKLPLPVSSADARRLARRTEGWVIALQLAAFSLRANPDVERFLPTFDGGHRHVFDYLTGGNAVVNQNQTSWTARGTVATRASESEKPAYDRICYDPFARQLTET